MWPFRRRPKLLGGDRVTWRFSRRDDLERRVVNDGNGWVRDIDREGVVETTALDGRLVKIVFNDRFGHQQIIWRKAKRVTPLDRTAPPAAPAGPPPLVDVRVLEEVVALQKAVGSADAMIDLLKSVRATYDIGKESAS